MFILSVSFRRRLHGMYEVVRKTILCPKGAPLHRDASPFHKGSFTETAEQSERLPRIDFRTSWTVDLGWPHGEGQ